jgi:hypothetical protein
MYEREKPPTHAENDSAWDKAPTKASPYGSRHGELDDPQGRVRGDPATGRAFSPKSAGEPSQQAEPGIVPPAPFAMPYVLGPHDAAAEAETRQVMSHWADSPSAVAVPRGQNADAPLPDGWSQSLSTAPALDAVADSSGTEQQAAWNFEAPWNFELPWLQARAQLGATEVSQGDSGTAAHAAAGLEQTEQHGPGKDVAEAVAQQTQGGEQTAEASVATQEPEGDKKRNEESEKAESQKEGEEPGKPADEAPPPSADDLNSEAERQPNAAEPTTEPERPQEAKVTGKTEAQPGTTLQSVDIPQTEPVDGIRTTGEHGQPEAATEAPHQEAIEGSTQPAQTLAQEVSVEAGEQEARETKGDKKPSAAAGTASAKAEGQRAPEDHLPAAMAQMEQSFGTDFSNVKISMGLPQETAQQGVQAVSAEEHIALDSSAVNLTSPEGKKVLGHELAHIAQKRQGSVTPDALDAAEEQARARQQQGSKDLSRRESLEVEADCLGERAAAGEKASVSPGARAPREPFWGWGLLDKAKQAVSSVSAKVKQGASWIGDKTKGVNWKEVGKNAVDLATDFIPGVSNVKDAYQAIMGKNPVTDEKLGWGSRILSGIFAIPGVGNVAKYIGKGGKLLGKQAMQLGPKATKWLGKGLRQLGPLLKKGGKWALDKAPNGGSWLWDKANKGGSWLWDKAHRWLKKGGSWIGNKARGFGGSLKRKSAESFNKIKEAVTRGAKWVWGKIQKSSPHWLKKAAIKVRDKYRAAKKKLNDLRRRVNRFLHPYPKTRQPGPHAQNPTHPPPSAQWQSGANKAKADMGKSHTDSTGIWDQATLADPKRKGLKDSIDSFAAGNQGKSVKDLALSKKTGEQIHDDLINKGFRHKRELLTVDVNGKREFVLSRPDASGKLTTADPKHSDIVPQDIYTHSDGGMVRVKPEGDPSSPFRPQAHANKSVMYNPKNGTDFNNEAFKVTNNGDPVPKSAFGPTGMKPKSAVGTQGEYKGYRDQIMDDAHTDLLP